MNYGVDEIVYLKTFVILHVDGVPEKSLYKTQFPRYAAIIGDKPFVRV